MKKTTLLKSMLLLCALIVGSGSVWATVKDVLTAADFKATTTTYVDFSSVSKPSGAIYAGQSAKSSSGGIQLRSKNSNSGIVSTTSPGKVKSVKITVESGTNTIEVWGSNTAYTAASDLYDSGKKGTKVGSVTATGIINFTSDYAYVGIRSNNGAIYITSIEIEWDVTVGADFSAAGWNTFSSSYKLDLSEVTGGTAYVATEVNASNKVVLTPVTDKIVAPNAGLMIKKEGTASAFTIKATSNDVTYAGTNLFVGVSSATDVPASTGSDYYYVFGWTDPASPCFYKVVSGHQPNLAAGKAYLHTTTALAANAFNFEFEDGDVTGIKFVETQKDLLDGNFYNLAGQKVQNPTKGLYIVNGKKVIIK